MRHCVVTSQTGIEAQGRQMSRQLSGVSGGQLQTEGARGSQGSGSPPGRTADSTREPAQSGASATGSGIGEAKAPNVTRT